MPAVVFLTAYDEFALQAFEAQALDYLLKPVISAFRGGAQAASKRLSTASPPREPSLSSPRAAAWACRYARSTGSKRKQLRADLERRPQLSPPRIAALLEERVRAKGFVRAHRRALVRLDGVRELTAKNGGLVAALACGSRFRSAPASCGVYGSSQERVIHTCRREISGAPYPPELRKVTSKPSGTTLRRFGGRSDRSVESGRWCRAGTRGLPARGHR
jgi:hypothetical protein